MKRNNRLFIILIIGLLIILLFKIYYIQNPKINLIEPEYEMNQFIYDNKNITIKFMGEITHTELFNDKKFTDIIYPIDNKGIKQGKIYNNEPNWLKFIYTINSVEKTVLIAKEPIMNYVSYDDLARSGLIFANNSRIYVKFDKKYYSQNITIKDINQNKYQIRLLDCKNSATNPTSEWNFLIGGIHEGDIDFQNRDKQIIYSFINKPYTDSDLKVGIDGSLNWCLNKYDKVNNYVVSRGYFYVSRFHASPSNIRTDRLYWRPVLELVTKQKNKKDDEKNINQNATKNIKLNVMNINQDIKYIGVINNTELFGNEKLSNLIELKRGKDLFEKPNWLKFEFNNKTILIAKKPIKYAISYQDLIDEKLIFGNRTIKDINRNEYLLRLIKCGNYTLDENSEWNLLIGAVSFGDEDFNNPYVYSTIKNPFSNEKLHIGAFDGGATWCQETTQINNKTYAVNRGYLTVSRYHATQKSFSGTGFSYRPVLELIKK